MIQINFLFFFAVKVSSMMLLSFSLSLLSFLRYVTDFNSWQIARPDFVAKRPV